MTQLAACRPRTDAAPSGVPKPLIVDLDHSLVRTDTLHEGLLAIAFQRPWALPASLAALRHGRAVFKRGVADRAAIDCAALPFDPAVLALIRERRAAGGEVHLVTAADQTIADGVTTALGLFDGAVGSDGRRNLKGQAKADALAHRFAGGFDYVGDSRADLPVWGRAGQAFVAGGKRPVLRRLSEAGIAAQELPCRRARPRHWIKALRLHQWSKNLLVLAPLMLSHEFTDPALLARAVAAWLLFGLAASATYLVNDLADLAADRQHPTKRFRAVAAGLIPIATAAPLALVLLVGGSALAWVLHPAFGAALSAYVTLTLLYSFRLKREPLVDVAVIAALFAIRVVAGMVVIDHPVSLWLTAFTAALFLSLALAKRSAELVQAAKALRPVRGRGYLPGDEPLTLALGVASGTVAVLLMVLYMSLDAMPSGLYAVTGPLYTMPAVLGLWIMRIWLLAHRGTLNDDPVIFALRDRASWLHAAAIGLLWLTAVGRIA